jgi:hypothetical protein
MDSFKEKPRRFKEGMLSIRQQYPNGYKFLLIVGTTVDQNGKEKINPSRWANWYTILSYFCDNKSQKIQVKSVYISLL